MANNFIAKVMRDGRYAGHIICLDDNITLIGLCNEKINDTRSFEEIVSDLEAEGCSIQITAIGADKVMELLRKEAA